MQQIKACKQLLLPCRAGPSCQMSGCTQGVPLGQFELAEDHAEETTFERSCFHDTFRYSSRASQLQKTPGR
jgi:hypothetical protein